jgi:hypothetical protein
MFMLSYPCNVRHALSSVLEFWSIVLHPGKDGGVIDMQSPLQHHLFKIPIAQRIAPIPADAQPNDISLEATSFKGDLVIHESDSSG